jgi:hypothetical protein
MNRAGSHGFIPGLLLGALLSLVVGTITVYFLVTLDVVSITLLDVPQIQVLFGWVTYNLGLSVVPFGVTLALYVKSLQRLAWHVDKGAPVDEVAQFEHLTDVWTSLFFGIGVIWTAIGMRSALLFALGDPETAANLGAFAVLQRLVDGGILTALTTTILGGIGGYLMRVTKSFFLGAKLSRYYEAQEQRQSARVERLLQDISESMGGGAGLTVPATCSRVTDK